MKFSEFLSPPYGSNKCTDAVAGFLPEQRSGGSWWATSTSCPDSGDGTEKLVNRRKGDFKGRHNCFVVKPQHSTKRSMGSTLLSLDNNVNHNIT